MDTIRYGNVILAEPPDHIEGYTESGDKVLQVQRPMRGRHGAVVDRGGELTVVTWTTVRDHEGYGQARSFVRQHRRAIQEAAQAGVDSVQFTVTGGGDAPLLNAVVTMTNGLAKGLRSWITYEVRGAEGTSGE